MSKITPEARERCACHTLQEQLAAYQRELQELKEHQSILALGQLLHERRLHQDKLWSGQAMRFEEMSGPD